MSWQEGQLGDLLVFQRGHDLPDYERKEGDVPVVGSAGVNGYHSVEKARAPCVSIGRSGASIGKPFYLDAAFWPHNACLYVKDFKGNNPKFLFYLLGRMSLDQFNSGAAQPSLNRNFIYGAKVSYPDRSGQDRIAAILSAYDDLIENNRRRIGLLEAAARQLYKEWFVRFRFPGHEHIKIIDGVPEGWKRTAASNTLTVLSGGTPATTNPRYWAGDIGFFTPKDAVAGAYVSFSEKTITETGLTACNSKLYPRDTLFITARGTVGKLNLALVPMAMNQSCYALVSNSCLSQRLLYLTMDDGIRQLQSQASGAVFAAITVATFERILVTLPDSNIAKAFDDFVNPMFDQIANLTKQTEQLAKARDLLLPRLMSGAIAV